MAVSTTTAPPAATMSISPMRHMLAGDPLARWLARLRFTPYLVTLMVAAYGALHSLVLPAVFGHLRASAQVPGALDDWPNLVLIVLLVPIDIGYYVWQPAFIQATYDALAAR